MAIAVVQRKTATDSGGAGGSVAAAFGSNVTAHNCIVAFVSMSDTTQVLFNKELQPPTDTLGNKYYQVGNAFNATFGVGMEIWVAYDILGGANTITATDNGNEGEINAYEISGLPSFAALNQSLVASIAAATSYNTGNMSATTVANAIILAAFASSPSDNWTAGSGYSSIQNIGGTQNTVGSEEKTVSSTGAYNATATHTNSQAGVAGILALGDTPTVVKVATIKLLGSVLNTTSGTHTVTATPAVGDLIVIVRAATGNTTSTAPTDNNSSGTYTKATSALKNSSADLVEIWVRNALIGAASSTVFTEAPGTTTGGGMHVYVVKGMLKVGSAAIKQVATQANNAANTTPTPTFGSSVTSPNPVITAVLNTTNSLVSAPVVPLNFATGGKNAYATPSTGLYSGYSEGGLFTGTALAWTGQSASANGAVAVELDSSSTNPKLSTFSDYFNAGSINTTPWFVTQNGSATVTSDATGAKTTFPASSTSSTDGDIFSNNVYDLTGSSGFIHAIDVPSSGTNADAVFEIIQSGGTGNGFRWVYEAGTLYAQLLTAYSPTTEFSVAYNSTTHAYWRIREASGYIYWDTGVDNGDGTVTWTNRASALNPFAIGVMGVLIGGLCYEAETSPGDFKWNNFNAIPVPSTGQNFFF